MMRDDTEDYRRRVRRAREGGSPLEDDEAAARETIRRLGRRYLGPGSLTASEERELRNALALVRRGEKMTAREIQLRARRGWMR